MGTFDRIELNGLEWQTKALGKGMHTYRPGDRVQAARVASTDDPRDVGGYTYDDLPDRYLVQIQTTAYALVEDGKLVGLASEADREELSTAKFDYYGRDEHDQLTHETRLFEPERPRRAMTPVPRLVRPTRRRRLAQRNDSEEGQQ